ncbi:hypothetical protein BDC45DRAFT_570038 [Circinella umbellata]|nr:hypothetical protein BDC45DRAFT_570038 [Circinella umbellata]
MNVQSTWLSPRAYTECAYMWPEATIYCYGGDVQPINTSCDNENKDSKNNKTSPDSGASNNTQEVDGCGENSTMIFYSLDLTQSKPLNELQNSWKLVGDGTGIGSNKHFTLSAITENNQNRLIMHGGIGDDIQGTRYVTGAYDIVNQTWEEVTDSLMLISRSYGHSAAVDNDRSIVHIYGGISDPISGFTLTLTLIDKLYSYIPSESFWNVSYVKEANEEYTYHREFHKAVYGNNDIIYHIGGLSPISEPEGYYPRYFEEIETYAVRMYEEIITYDIKKDSWKYIKTNEDIYPTGRIYHSATLLPETNEIVLFGGLNPENGEAVEDFFYILDTITMKWEYRNLGYQDPNNKDSAIIHGHYGHSALLVSTHLFIMFGNDHNHQATNNTWVLDTRSWKWVTYIDGIEPTRPAKGPAYLPHDDDGYGSPLEKPGTIIGAVVGSVAGLAIFVIVGLVYIKRRRRNAAQQDNEAINTTEVENVSTPLQRNSSDSSDNDHTNITPAPPQYSLHDGNQPLPKMDNHSNDDSNSQNDSSRLRNNNNGYQMIDS